MIEPPMGMVELAHSLRNSSRREIEEADREWQRQLWAFAEWIRIKHPTPSSAHAEIVNLSVCLREAKFLVGHDKMQMAADIQEARARTVKAEKARATADRAIFMLSMYAVVTSLALLVIGVRYFESRRAVRQAPPAAVTPLPIPSSQVR